MSHLEAGRGRLQLPDWYPKGVVTDMSAPLEQSWYGPPNSETLNVFAALLRLGSTIGDIGGGEARYGLPLARMGYQVINTDVDRAPLLRAKNKTLLPGVTGVGRIENRLTDATKGLAIEDGSLDGVLNAGFGYLMPPDQLRELFGKMTRTLRQGGVMVFEFATNRDRRKPNGETDRGDNEYNYTHDEGMEILKAEFERNGFGDLMFQEKTIHMEEPYYLHNDLIIASAIKK